MDHDRLFKELLRTYFIEFIAAFAPQLLAFLDVSSIEFLDKEVFTDISSGDRHEVDLLVKVRFKGQETFFLIHVENQATSWKDFAARMYRYFARLHEKYGLPIYPIALLSYDSPLREEPNRYEVSFPNLRVLQFEFHAIQLNRLNWRDFLRNPNPVVAALMTKMQIAPEDRPKVALECLRMISTLKLDRARQTLIHSFMDSYLRLSAEERKVYNRQVESISEPERQALMQITNQWEEHGIRIGQEQGSRAILLRLLSHKFESVSTQLREQIDSLSQDKLEQLADAVLDFSTVADVQSWMARNG